MRSLLTIFTIQLPLEPAMAAATEQTTARVPAEWAWEAAMV